MNELVRIRALATAAQDIQQLVDEAGFGISQISATSAKCTWVDLFDELITCKEICDVSRTLFCDQHYARAVEEAFKCLNNLTKEKSGMTNKDGADLMNQVFSANNPILRLNKFGSKSEKDEQLGYMQIYAGSMTGIRNPRAHEHDLRDDPKVALELLVIANHLMRKLDSATQSQT